MSFTDTHTHLYLEQFKDDLDTVIENAISSGVNRLFFPAINSNYTDLMLDLKKKYRSLVCIVVSTNEWSFMSQ